VGVPDAGNCFVGLEEFGNHLHRVEVQVVASEAAKWGNGAIIRLVLNIDQIPLSPPHKDAKTVLLDVGDRRIDFQCLADRLAALCTQVVVPEAAKRGP